MEDLLATKQIQSEMRLEEQMETLDLSKNETLKMQLEQLKMGREAYPILMRTSD